MVKPHRSMQQPILIYFQDDANGQKEVQKSCVPWYVARWLHFWAGQKQIASKVFLQSDAAATIRGRELFECGVYFFGKPADINDGWINSVRAIQGRRLDAVRSKRSLLVLLSALVEPLAKILGEELGQHSICITSKRIQEHRSRMIGHSPFVLVWFWLSRFVMATLAAVLEPKICLQGEFASQ